MGRGFSFVGVSFLCGEFNFPKKPPPSVAFIFDSGRKASGRPPISTLYCHKQTVTLLLSEKSERSALLGSASCCCCFLAPRRDHHSAPFANLLGTWRAPPALICEKGKSDTGGQSHTNNPQKPLESAFFGKTINRKGNQHPAFPFLVREEGDRTPRVCLSLDRAEGASSIHPSRQQQQQQQLKWHESSRRSTRE